MYVVVAVVKVPVTSSAAEGDRCVFGDVRFVRECSAEVVVIKLRYRVVVRVDTIDP